MARFGSRAVQGIREYFWDEDRAILSVLAILSVAGAFLYLGGTFRGMAPYTYYAFGRVQEVIHGPGDAADTYSAVLGYRPTWGEIYYRRGKVFQARKELEKALADFEMAAEFLPLPGKAYRAHAHLVAEQGLTDQALWDLKVAMDKEPLEGRNYLERADLYMKEERYQDALADYRKAKTLNPKLLDAQIGVEEAERAIDQAGLNRRLNTGE